MIQKDPKILREINELISSVENSGIQKNDKLKVVKVLLVIKLKLIELLKEELKKEARVMYRVSPERSREGSPRTKQDAEHVRGFVRGSQCAPTSYGASPHTHTSEGLKTESQSGNRSMSGGAGVAKNGGQDIKLLKKHDLIVQFIKQNSGRVSAAKLMDLGIAGRTLRRYIKNLSDSGKVLVEKKGREHFYSVIS